MQEQETELREKIAELKKRYSKLKETCGLRVISKETIAEYARELQRLEAQLNLALQISRARN